MLHAIPRLVNSEERLTDIDGLPPRPQEFPAVTALPSVAPAMTRNCLTAYPPQSGADHHFYCIHPVGGAA
ncbi:hypothetical protein RIE95_06090 [Acidithiobacillus thiooxidans]|uniref:hypothetical protein n=1 Tax=Acidithiobacillus thiooxidans TaxID=930 RepID=UPI00285EADD5|nr:hypothetical protein [Acidithiobacillus thiooxidans]MDR7926563.1 hypothetical protein [Acidithiobacillus thiooxidans]